MFQSIWQYMGTMTEAHWNSILLGFIALVSTLVIMGFIKSQNDRYWEKLTMFLNIRDKAIISNLKK